MNTFAYYAAPNAWLIIAVVALVLFGGARLPQLARGMGESMREFKKGIGADTSSEAK